MSNNIYDKNSFLKGLVVGLALGRKAYDYIWKYSDTTPVTDNVFLEKQSLGVINNITAHDVTSRHLYLGQEPDQVYIAYISSGVAHVKYAISKKKLVWQQWIDADFSQEAIDVAIEFDGSFHKTLNGEEFITDENPFVFWITPDGSLKCCILGLLGETFLSSNCSKVTAIRATGDSHGLYDFGLIVFFISNGQIYYRQLIKGNWTNGQQVRFGPSVYWTDIAAFRTQDYRIILQAKDSNNDIYELFTQFQGVGRHGTEHLEISDVSITTGSLIGMRYMDAKNKDEHIYISAITVNPSPYGGLYEIGYASIINAYNIEDSNDDWGTTLVIVFDKHLVASDISAQPNTFTLIDSRNSTFIAISATLGLDGKTVTLRFLNFNNANGTCQIVYTPGTITSMAGVALITTSYSFVPEHLVPSIIPAPEVYSITNIGADAWNN